MNWGHIRIHGLTLSIAFVYRITNDWHSSVGWTASRVPRTGRPHLLHMSPECTSYGCVASAAPACLWFPLRSLHLADPGKQTYLFCVQNQNAKSKWFTSILPIYRNFNTHYPIVSKTVHKKLWVLQGKCLGYPKFCKTVAAASAKPTTCFYPKSAGIFPP